MKKLVVQVDIHPSKLVGNFQNLTGRKRDEDLIARSKKSVQQYAKRYGADYELIDEPNDPTKHPWCERFRLFHEDKYDQYDAILYLDIDVICRRKAPSIFRYAKRDTFLAANRLPENQWIIDLWKRHAMNNPVQPVDDLNKFVHYQFNSGVLLFGQDTREHLHKRTNWERMENWYWKDQMELSHICMEAEEAGEFKFERLPWQYNDDLITPKGVFHHHKNAARKRK